MGRLTKGQMFPVQVLLSRSQMLKKQTKTALGRKETLCKIWMPPIFNLKEKMVSLLGLIAFAVHIIWKDGPYFPIECYKFEVFLYN